MSQSIAFAYRPDGARVKTEDDPLLDDAPGPFASGVAARSARWRASCSAPRSIDGLVLRYGFFYGPGTHYDAATAPSPRTSGGGACPSSGRGTGVFSFIHVDDAADATVAAVERGAPGIYNVVDDEPAPMREWVPVLAEAAGAKPPRRVPVWLARLVAGSQAADFALELRGASNEKAKRELGWEPAHPSWRRASRSRCAATETRCRRAAGRSSRRRSAESRPRPACAT